ncbi:MAG: sigma 54-interacting transcriptional regulator [Gammaproteobacteria bacterium]|nr:sigma 54-interacting transcriptional regulator [Gammaproteobacteria bacterium]
MEIKEKNKQSLEDFINLTRELASENDINKLLGAIIKESIKITKAEGGKIYLPDITKKYFSLKYVCMVDESLTMPILSTNKKSFDVNNNKFQTLKEINFSSSVQSERYKISKISLQEKGVINSNNYLIYSAITGSVLELNRDEHFSSYTMEHLYEFDQVFSCHTNKVLVMSLRDHDGTTIGLLELNNYSSKINHNLLNAFSSLSAVLINNTNLVSHNSQLIQILDESNQALENENMKLKRTIEKKYDYSIIGKSDAMKSIFLLLDKVVDSNVTVFLRGDTGTGKEVFANAIHKNSPRKNQLMVSQNCAALPENLLESELFGYKKGAFTGAIQDKSGLFDQADGGTLFLDEIGDMPINLQAKVLRVIQEQEIRPLGASHSHKVDVRLIAATHCDLEEKISRGEFRQDLFYRLNIFPIHLPKLCERDNDILLLIKYFVDYYCKHYGRNIKKISPNVIELLTRYDFPGNVRELQNIIERSILLCDENGILLEEHLPIDVVDKVSNQIFQKNKSFSNVVNKNDCLFPLNSLKSAVQEYEANLIKNNLRANDWNQTLTAQVLRLPRRTLVEKISRLNIVTPK